MKYRITVTLADSADEEAALAVRDEITNIDGVTSSHIDCLHGPGDLCEYCDEFGL
jgi:hypothetical protein